MKLLLRSGEETNMDEVVKKRVLLAKEFYFNGINHAEKNDPLNKMMAVHNFHIAIEIIVKSILIHYEIRSEKGLSIDFETMLNDVDKFQYFKDKGQKLPYRQNIRNLNQMRNLIQHHVIEPSASDMNDWRLYSSRFLIKVFEDYFGIDFESVSRVSFIDDVILRKYLEKAQMELSIQDYESASCFAAGAFEYASHSLSNFIPRSHSEFFITSSLGFQNVDNNISDAFKKTLKRVDEAEHFTSLLATGLSLSDYKKYKDAAPFVIFLEDGSPRFENYQGRDFTVESSKWLINFVISIIIKWQQQGLNPEVMDYLKQGASKEINEE